MFDGIETGATFAINFVDGVNVGLPNWPPHEVALYNGEGELVSAVTNATGIVRFPFCYLDDWTVEVSSQRMPVWHHTFNPAGQTILVNCGSRSMGDTLAWVPAIETLQKRWGCKVVAWTHHNEWFQAAYPNIEFIGSGQTVPNIYAQVTVGWFYDDINDRPDWRRTPWDFRQVSLEETASGQLGVAAKWEPPRLAINWKPKQPVSQPYVCLGIHSTAQAKYWNNPKGWQGVTDWLRRKGYRVFIASREGNGWMGNHYPEGAEILPNYEIETTATFIRHAKAFVGLGSGLSWLAWALRTPLVLISGFSEPCSEMPRGPLVERVEAPLGVCSGCFNRHRLQADKWDWCPDREGSQQFECTKRITAEDVIQSLEALL